jgi:hypothetical protein
MARASDWDGPQGANRSHSLGYGEDLQRRGPPKSEDARLVTDLFRGSLSLPPLDVAYKEYVEATI